MKKMLTSLVLLTSATLSMAQSPPPAGTLNPSAPAVVPPPAATGTPAPSTQAATGVPTGPNPFARPSSNTPAVAQPSMAGGPTATAPGMPVAPAIPGMPGMPGAPNNGMPSGLPGLPGSPSFQPPGQPGAGPAIDAAMEEDVSVVRVGKVNGQYIYRGTGTYLFEATSKKKLVRKPVLPTTAAGGLDLPQVPGPGGAPGITGNLPSQVGRPAANR